MNPLVGLVLVFGVCLIFSTLFSAVESAYGTLRGREVPGAAGLVPDDLLHALALGNLAANSGAAAAATLGLRLLAGEPSLVELTLLVLGLTLILLIPCEMVPSSVGALDPGATVRRWLPLLRPWLWISRPFARALTRLSNAVRGLVSFGLRAARLTAEDVATAVTTAEEHRELDRGERDMVRSIFGFGNTTVREIMVPRPDVVAVEERASFAEVMQVARDAEHSRLPVYRETLDQVVGIVYVKDLLARRYGLDGGSGLERLVREASHVPESKKIDDLLREFQASGTHIAIVVDEYGGTAGLLTIEDILEEIVGEIQDEHDLEEPLYVQEADGSVLVDARMNLYDFGEALGIPLQGEGFETVGGLVYSLLGRVPEPGEEVASGPLALQVAEVEGRRITRVRVLRLPDDARVALEDARRAEEA